MSTPRACQRQVCDALGMSGKPTSGCIRAGAWHATGGLQPGAHRQTMSGLTEGTVDSASREVNLVLVLCLTQISCADTLLVDEPACVNPAVSHRPTEEHVVCRQPGSQRYRSPPCSWRKLPQQAACCVLSTSSSCCACHLCALHSDDEHWHQSLVAPSRLPCLQQLPPVGACPGVDELGSLGAAHPCLC